MIRKKVLLIRILFLLRIFFSPVLGAQSVDDLILITEDYPPFNFIKDDYLQGISVDLLDLMLKNLESKLSRDDIKLLPWARGYNMLLKNRNTCLFATVRSEMRENKFKWVGPVAKSSVSLLAKKESQITIGSIDDIKKYRVGVVISDIGEQLLVEAGIDLKDLRRLSGNDVIIRSIKQLGSNRIDIISYEEIAFMWTLKEMDLNRDDYEVVYNLSKNDLYYAFNLDTPDIIINELQNALNNLKKDGTYLEIIQKYK
jgi:ABC-type amino acid transport substrate-binding protein